MPAVFDRYSNSFIKIYFEIPAGREDEIARKVLIKHLQVGQLLRDRAEGAPRKFPQPELGPWVSGLPDGRHRLAAVGARGLGAARALRPGPSGRVDAELVAGRGGRREGAGAGAEPAPGPALDGDQRAEVCIVGGGYTGLWTALRIKEQAPDTDVAVVEADICGGGPSGRNGGFAMSFWHHFQGLEDGVRQRRGAAAVAGLVRRGRPTSAASAPSTGSTPTTSTTAGCGRRPIPARWGRGTARWRRSSATASGRSSRSSPSDLTGRTGSPRYIAGVFEPTSATVQPALLARGLARVARERGVRVFEGSPMRSLDRSSPLVVRTDRGSVTADRVVLALNAWTGQLRELRRAMVVVTQRHRDHRPGPGGPEPQRLDATGRASRTHG